MHTFFVNTSQQGIDREFDRYFDILEIQRETRDFIPLDCPFATWQDAEKGYKSCVQKMGKMIDSYTDINNEFNLMIYIDLYSYPTYVDRLTVAEANGMLETGRCGATLRALLKQLIADTLVKELTDNARSPHQTFIVFEGNLRESKADKTLDKNHPDLKKEYLDYAREFLGIPSTTTKEPDGGEKNKSVRELCEWADTFLKQRKELQADEGEGDQSVLDSVLDEVLASLIFPDFRDPHSHDSQDISEVSFATDRIAARGNKRERARRNLRLCAYILSYINDINGQTGLDQATSNQTPEPPQLNADRWTQVEEQLIRKKALYNQAYHEAMRQDSIKKLELAPPLYAFDEKKLRNPGKLLDQLEDPPLGSSEKAEEQGPKHAPQDKAPDSSGNAAELEDAKKLCDTHRNYMRNLRHYVLNIMSNYAGRSLENEPALLRKRKVSLSEADLDSDQNDYQDYPYATKEKQGEPDKLKSEGGKLENVRFESKDYYDSALTDYMKHCLPRAVAKTDIEEQYQRYNQKVEQIAESRRKIQAVAIYLFFAIIALYIPFVSIQWTAIMKNELTMLVAIVSIAVPLVLLYMIFAIMFMKQKKKRQEVYDNFVEESNKVMEGNRTAVEAYRSLLQFYIPSLRWIYEYKLDVTFYEICCGMARAKIKHHQEKLRERIETVGNIIEDLEISDKRSPSSPRADSEDLEISDKRSPSSPRADSKENPIDYYSPFCSENNRNFYSIIDQKFLQELQSVSQPSDSNT